MYNKIQQQGKEATRYYLESYIKRVPLLKEEGEKNSFSREDLKQFIDDDVSEVIDEKDYLESYLEKVLWEFSAYKSWLRCFSCSCCLSLSWHAVGASSKPLDATGFIDLKKLIAMFVSEHDQVITVPPIYFLMPTASLRRRFVVSSSSVEPIVRSIFSFGKSQAFP